MALYKFFGLEMDSSIAQGATLIVGDGNFSFSVSFANSIVQELPKENISLFCTSYDGDDIICQDEEAKANVELLKSYKSVAVMHDVDATKLANRFAGILFSSIIFNFPHVGGKSNIKACRELLKLFFRSASNCLLENGIVYVALCKGQSGTPMDIKRNGYGNSWQIVTQAAESGLILHKIKFFNCEEYPFYHSVGYRGNLKKSFRTEGALGHIFIKGVSLPKSISFGDVGKEDLLNAVCTMYEEKAIALNPCFLSSHPLCTLKDILCSALENICQLQLGKYPVFLNETISLQNFLHKNEKASVTIDSDCVDTMLLQGSNSGTTLHLKDTCSKQISTSNYICTNFEGEGSDIPVQVTPYLQSKINCNQRMVPNETNSFEEHFAAFSITTNVSDVTGNCHPVSKQSVSIRPVADRKMLASTANDSSLSSKENKSFITTEQELAHVTTSPMSNDTFSDHVKVATFFRESHSRFTKDKGQSTATRDLPRTTDIMSNLPLKNENILYRLINKHGSAFSFCCFSVNSSMNISPCGYPIDHQLVTVVNDCTFKDNSDKELLLQAISEEMISILEDILHQKVEARLERCDKRHDSIACNDSNIRLGVAGNCCNTKPSFDTSTCRYFLEDIPMAEWLEFLPEITISTDSRLHFSSLSTLTSEIADNVSGNDIVYRKVRFEEYEFNNRERKYFEKEHSNNSFNIYDCFENQVVESVCLKGHRLATWGFIPRLFNKQTADDRSKDQTLMLVFSLESIVMAAFDIADTRLLWSTDEAFLKQLQKTLIDHQEPVIPTVVFPLCFRHDLCFWIEDAESEELLLAAIRYVTFDCVHSVKLLRILRHEETNSLSYCYRLIYSRCDGPLSHKETVELQNDLRRLLLRLNFHLR